MGDVWQSMLSSAGLHLMLDNSPSCWILDTIPAFLGYWSRWRGADLATKVENWAASYVSAWPELLELQLQE